MAMPRRGGEIGACSDDGGRLAAQLQRDGGEVGGGGLGDLASDGGRSGEEEMVKRQAAEGDAEVASADKDGEEVGGKVCCNQRLQEFGESRREFAGFEDDAVPCRECSDARREREIEWIVPGTEDADDADGLAFDTSASGEQLPGGGNALWPHPAPEVAQGVSAVCDRDEGLGERGLEAGAVAEVDGDGVGIACFIVFNQREQCLTRCRRATKDGSGSRAKAARIAAKMSESEDVARFTSAVAMDNLNFPLAPEGAEQLTSWLSGQERRYQNDQQAERRHDQVRDDQCAR